MPSTRMALLHPGMYVPLDETIDAAPGDVRQAQAISELSAGAARSRRFKVSSQSFRGNP